jgi:hypothetical protein
MFFSSGRHFRFTAPDLQNLISVSKHWLQTRSAKRNTIPINTQPKAERRMHSVRLNSILHLSGLCPNYPQPPPNLLPKKFVFRRKIDADSVKHKFLTLKHPPILDCVVDSE